MVRDNKGFSLVEVMVVVAITSFVFLMAFAFIVNSNRMFNREAAKIDFQSESQLIVNNLNEAFMEATKLEIKKETLGTIIDLGNYDATSFASLDKTFCRRLYFDSGTKYLGLIVNSSYLASDYSTLVAARSTGDEQLDGYRLSLWVSSFDAQIDDSCHKTATTAMGTTEDVFLNPLKVNVSFTLTNGSDSKEYKISVKLRNSLESVVTDLGLGDGLKTYRVVDKVKN